jgi:hypothetical protein
MFGIEEQVRSWWPYQDGETGLMWQGTSASSEAVKGGEAT